MSKVLVVIHNPEGQTNQFIEMANGSIIKFSEIGKLDSIMLYEGGMGGGLPYILQNRRVMEDWIIIEEISKYPTKLLTQPEKKDTINPSKLLVKLIGRI